MSAHAPPRSTHRATSDGLVAQFHPAVAAWFERTFPEGPTEAQRLGWDEIRHGRDTLVAAPTGSGKTLAGFLVTIDELYRAHDAGEELGGTTRVVYVSPLKALAVDIHQNLERPLREIREIARELGLDAPDLRVAVRSGDSTPTERAAMLREPPHFLITTPESLYLLVTSERSRERLRDVRTVIVDEIHAVADNKRGSHLTLTLERLTHVARRPPTRIGLSATQRPLDAVARLLVGAGPGRADPGGAPRCSIVDAGHRRDLDVALFVPETELEAAISTEQMSELLDDIAANVGRHRTTLVFVNTRRLAERVAHQLGERLGEDSVSAHHGSLSKERRLRVETQLRAGELRALVATASLELGIDIGPVELVCQLGSPRSIATFLQRVGRANHSRHGTPSGRLYPTTRDELVECTALLRAVRGGRLDSLIIPERPLDVLAQQIVAEVAAEEWREDELFDLVRRAAPYAALSRDDFEGVLELVSEGVRTGRGQRGRYLHRDRVNGVLRPRRGARLAALTSGGAIPELGDYRVVAEPHDTFVGTVNEDFAIEAGIGSVFLLGTHPWQIRRVTPGLVRVVDATGKQPNVPFWFGEAPARTEELSAEVGDLRSGVERQLRDHDRAAAVAWVVEEAGVDPSAADQLVAYLATGLEALGLLPTPDRLVVERFFDEAGGMQLVIHAPLGGRINRGLGLALRKRFCVTFDFELQAAASDDAICISLGPHHSFPLTAIPRFLTSNTVERVLSQAVLTSPIFAARWRWNLNRALVVLRMRGGKKNPPPIQRMESDDLMAAVFPTLAACQENVSGPIEIPDHPLVRETMHDCLHEAMDIDGLRELIAGIEAGSIAVETRDTVEPSVLAHEILTGPPYTFLDEAPLEERRSHNVVLRRGLPVEPHELAAVESEAIDRVREEVRPEARTPDELHDLLLSLVVSRGTDEWREHFDGLVADRRVTTLSTPNGEELWCAIERRPVVEHLLPGATFSPDHPVPAGIAVGAQLERESAAAEALRGHLEVLGPATASELADATGLPRGLVDAGVARLEAEGFALRGSFDAGVDEEQWCARRLLTRIHSYSQQRRRREIEPVSSRDFMRFLLRWQFAAPGTQREGRAGVLQVVEQLQGFEVAAGAWEESVLRARVERYRSEWLDDLCLSGQIAWGRLTLKRAEADRDVRPRRSGATPSRATPISFAIREDLSWLLPAVRGGQEATDPRPGRTLDVLDALRGRGALFRSEIAQATGRLPAEVDEALWDGVAQGLITADGFQAVRSLLSPADRWAKRQAHRRGGLRRGAAGRGRASTSEGRWSRFPARHDAQEVDERIDPDELAEAVAEQLLARWGVVFYDLLVRETLSVPWREILWALRRMEARGTIRGGRFVAGFHGEQFALPSAVDGLKRIRSTPTSGETVRLSAVDPLNLVGIVVPGDRVSAVRSNTVTYVDGVPADLAEARA